MHFCSISSLLAELLADMSTEDLLGGVGAGFTLCIHVGCYLHVFPHTPGASLECGNLMTRSPHYIRVRGGGGVLPESGTGWAHCKCLGCWFCFDGAGCCWMDQHPHSMPHAPLPVLTLAGICSIPGQLHH